MNKAGSRGLDGDARRRLPGERDGRSLGDWLHGAIEDQARELGLPPRRLRHDLPSDGVRRLAAGSIARGSRHDESSAATTRDRVAHATREPIAETREARVARAYEDREARYPADAPARPDPRRERRPVASADAVPAEGDGYGARHAGRSGRRDERPLDNTLATIAAMMQTSEERRAEEREAVDALASKMASLETKLTERMTSGENPIRGALARLEARLDIIGKRGDAETVARQSLTVPEPDPESVQRLEEKLNTILEAIRFRPTETSHLAVQAVQRAEPAPRRSLGEAIAEIARRQEALEVPSVHGQAAAGLAPRGDEGRGEGLPRVPAFDAPAARARPVLPTARADGAEADGVALDGLHDDIRSISQAMDNLRSGKAVRAAAAAEAPPTLVIRRDGNDAALDKIERQLATLAGRVDEALARKPVPVRLPAPKLDTSGLETLVRDLGAKIEAVRAPGADLAALDALQEQVERLSARFERSEQGLAILPTLAASVRELFNQLEGTRANVEASATHAAREVLRIAAGDGRAALAQPEAPASKADADRSTRALDAMHGILDGMVDQLSTLDTPRAQPSTQRPAAPQPAPATPDPSLRAAEAVREPVVPLPVPRRAPEPDGNADDTAAERASYIAAARRAAKAARSEPHAVPLVAPARRPASPAAQRDARAGLLAKSRDYVAAHKRPMLMAMAAIVMVLGTLTLIQQVGLGGAGLGGGLGGRDLVAANPSAKTEPRVAVAKLAPERGDAAGALSPSALPRAATPLATAIPGSDPIQTGSIPSLPAFAAASNAPRPVLPAGLKAAADAGVGAAQYDLGSRYADGRAVARDPKLAVVYLEKAADQGLVPAQYRLASIYEKGLGVAPDKARARSLYTQAAEAGNPRAMHNLAVMLADGEGHPDYAGAANWFRKAAGYGVHDSQYNLAVLLARGLGVTQSLTQSYQWFAIAAAQDDADAAKKRDEIGSKLGANDLAIAKAFAAAFQPKAANPATGDVAPPPGGWNGATSATRVNTPKSRMSSL